MADNTETNPDAEARKWFMIAIVGAILYVSTVFMFIIMRDVEPDTASQQDPQQQGSQQPASQQPASQQPASQQQEVPQHGQSH